jgi:hypothetical protein
MPEKYLFHSSKQIDVRFMLMTKDPGFDKVASEVTN